MLLPFLQVITIIIYGKYETKTHFNYDFALISYYSYKHFLLTRENRRNVASGPINAFYSSVSLFC